ncbi:MAG: ACP S-malonyltransferase [Gammaproteobacteria bacterium]|nr:ACP S-malonyltransferase [Gammaproteobacteria bacterium]
MTNNESKTLVIFPGQGSQYPGIGSDLYEAYATARDVYKQASDVLGYDIAELSFKDSDSQINMTRFTQPVLLTHSIACLEVFKELTANTVQAQLAAGHSLGEYSALVAAGSLKFETALGLVKTRGELMGEHGEGEMEALPFDLETAKPLAEKYYCAVAACNLPEQTVAGGRSEDLDKLVTDINENFPNKRTARLKTEGAFHTYYMVKAAQLFREHLDAAEFISPEIDVLSNYSGDLHDVEPDSIRAKLFLQLFYPVLWHANLQTAAGKGANRIIEFGGGLGKGESPAEKRPNLEGIVKKTFRRSEHKSEYHSVINIESLEKTVQALTT